VNEDFRFRTDQWRACVTSDIEVPQDADVRIVLDSSPTASDTSDRSALVAGYVHTRESDGENELVVLDFESARWKGMALPDAVIDFVFRVTPSASKLQIEHIPSTDLLVDSILLRAQMREVFLPRIEWINPASKVKGAKSKRIVRLQDVVAHQPPKIRIRWNKNIGMLLEEVENFVPSEQNRGRQCGLLDAISLLANIRV
jgi:hypothetical protein